jgi:hypothetical protein
LVASGRHSAAEDEPDFTRAQQLDEKAHTFATGANVAYVIGGAVLSAGLVWMIIELTSE